MSHWHDIELFDAEAFDEELGQKPDQSLGQFKAALKSAHDVLCQRFHQGRVATELVYSRAQVVDQILLRAWQRFFPSDTNDIALVAVGGYGRGELHPASDVDVMILLANRHANYKSAIEQFLMFLWDIGLEVGQSVRTVKECVQEARQDITVVTNLQEARLLTGPEKLFDEQRRLCSPKRIWSSRDFFAAKLKEQIERHQRYHDTAYNLEPNIKEGPGGLRDIQVIGWVAKRHFGVEKLSELVSHGFLTENEYRSLHEGQAFLWHIRFGLHILTNRREDRLLFDHQRALAKQLGYRDDSRHLAVEYLMKQYYRTVMELSRLNEMLLQLFKEEILFSRESGKPVPINSRFQARKGFIEVVNEGIFKRYPFALLEVFLLLEQQPELHGVRANTIRLIRDHCYLIDSSFRDDLRCKSLFMEIMRQPRGVTHELRRMNRYGVLAAYLPVFEHIVGQMQHDLFHVYTVDEHTLMVIRNLRRFTVEEFHDEFPLCSSIIRQVPKQEILLLAALFHDIAKGRGGDHSTLGARDAEIFCQSHGLSAYDSRMISWLVQNHLFMSTTAQRKDISNPEVVHEFAQHVGDKTHLEYLYLLTVADIRATGPNVWNSWKDALLRELYVATKHAFRRGLENPIVVSERIEEYQSICRETLELMGFNKEAIDTLWQRLGDEYFIRYTPDEIVWHCENILDASKNSLPLVLLRQQPRSGVTEIFIHSATNSNLFTIVTTLIEQFNLTVMDARIFTSTDSYTLDTFLVLQADGSPFNDEERAKMLLEKMRHHLNDPSASTPGITERLPRVTKHFKFPTEVSFDVDPHYSRTIMKVVAFDRPGLLAKIGSAMHSCRINLQNAKIATFGERAEDIFYITDEDDQVISDQKLLEQLKTKIEALLDQQS